MPAVRSGISAQYRLIGGVQHRFGERKQSLAHGREHQRHTTATHEQVAGIKIFEFCNGLTDRGRSEEHTSELQSLMRISYAVFCLKKKKENNDRIQYRIVITK